jgi:hypothetical protein
MSIYNSTASVTNTTGSTITIGTVSVPAGGTVIFWNTTLSGQNSSAASVFAQFQANVSTLEAAVAAGSLTVTQDSIALTPTQFNAVMTTMMQAVAAGTNFAQALIPVQNQPTASDGSPQVTTGFSGVPASATPGSVFGYNSTSAAANAVIRAAAYAPPGTNAQRSIVSTSASDAPAGAGALTVVLTYLNTSMVLKSETLTLNGTTPVNTVGTDIAFVESIVVATTGTAGGANVGTLTLMTGTAGGGTAIASVPAGSGNTEYAAHYVPAGVSCYLVGMSAGSAAVLNSFFLASLGNPTVLASPFNALQPLSGAYMVPSGGQSLSVNFPSPIVVPGPNLIQMYCRPFAATASTNFGQFNYFQR